MQTYEYHVNRLTNELTNPQKYLSPPRLAVYVYLPITILTP